MSAVNDLLQAGTLALRNLAALGVSMATRFQTDPASAARAGAPGSQSAGVAAPGTISAPAAQGDEEAQRSSGLPPQPKEPKVWEQRQRNIVWFFMFLNCTSFAFQHTLLWSGPVSPSVTLNEGEEKRPAGPIVADAFTVLSSLLLAFALDYVGRGLGMAVSLGTATIGLALFAASYDSPMRSAGQVFYGMGSTGVKAITDVLVVETVRQEIDMPLAYAFMALPRAIALFSVPTVRYGLREPERHVLIAFSCVVPALGAPLVCVLWYYRAHLVLHKPFRHLMMFVWARHSNRPAFLAGRFLLVATLLVVFLVLWLVQMDVSPWPAAIPPLVASLIVTAPFCEWARVQCQPVWFHFRFFLIPSLSRTRVRVRYRWQRRQWFKFRGLTSMLMPVRRARNFCRGLGREVASWSSGLKVNLQRWHLGTSANVLSWVSGLSFRSVFLGYRLMSNSEFAVCASCLTWKMAHTCWSTNLHPYLQVAFSKSSVEARYLISMSTATEHLGMLLVGLYAVYRPHEIKPANLKSVPLYCFGLVVFILAISLGHIPSLFVASQVLLAVSRSAFEVTKELALLADCRYEWPDFLHRSPTLLAYLGLSEKVGGMIGATISDILWAKALHNPPNRYLNGQTILSAERVHPNLGQHLATPQGSPERGRIISNYDETQAIALAISGALMALAFLCLRGIQTSRHFTETLKRRDLSVVAYNSFVEEIVDLLDKHPGRQICEALKAPIHSQDLVEAYVLDMTEYKSLRSLKPEGRRMAVSRAAEATSPKRFTDPDIRTLEDFELRQSLYLALKDEEHCRRMLVALDDETVREQHVGALLSYRTIASSELCFQVREDYELWAKWHMRSM